MKFYVMVGRNSGTNRLDYGGNSGLDSDPGIYLKESCHCGIKVVVGAVTDVLTLHYDKDNEMRLFPNGRHRHAPAPKGYCRTLTAVVHRKKRVVYYWSFYRRVSGHVTGQRIAGG